MQVPHGPGEAELDRSGDRRRIEGALGGDRSGLLLKRLSHNVKPVGFDEKALRSFVTVAEAGSIGSAAVALNVSQPALSRLIRAFEHQNNADLFERRSTGVALTPAGQALLPYARSLLFEMEQADGALRVLRGLQPGIVRVGAIPTAVDKIVMPAVNQMHDASRDLQVQLLEANDDGLFAAIKANVIDLVIGPHVTPCDEICQLGEHLFEDSWGVLCNADHPLTSRGVDLAPSDILPGRWAMPPLGATPRALFDDIVRRHGLPQPQVAIQTTSPEAIISAVINAGVLGWLPELLCARELASGLVVRLPISVFRLPDRMFVYKRSRGILSPDARRFYNALLQASKALAEE